MDPDSEYGSRPKLNADPTGSGSETLMKMVTNHTNLPKSRWGSQVQFLLFDRIQKAATAVIEEFPETASTHINVFF
jgi:hypothetical protein